MTRICIECRVIKRLIKFGKNKGSKGGRLNICNKCHYQKYKHIHSNRLRFGNNRIEVLKRDGFKCVKCSMTNQEHIIKYNCELSIDHIDNKGRYSKVKNHALDNLQTMCLSCHGKKDNPKKEMIYEG